MDLKKCSTCEEVKSLEEFHRKSAAPDGRRHECKLCAKEYHAFKYKRDREKYNARSREWYQENREKRLQQAKTYRDNHPDETKARLKDHYQRNKPYYQAKKVRRREKKRKAALPTSCKETEQEFFTKAIGLTSTTGVQHHVDHIVPLNGKNVSGLHVHWNLQVLTAEENKAKGNTFEPEEEET